MRRTATLVMRNCRASTSNVHELQRWLRSPMYMSNGTSSAAGRSTNANAAAGLMKRRINHADAMRSTPGRGRVTQRRFENVFADENAEAAKLAETQRRRGGAAETTRSREAQSRL